ncbi:MAG: hypothetical protein K6E85_00870 [Lachnospiraceae bacterium]|nr:hypothetical protein [Lachnospiraceae bacterium]
MRKIYNYKDICRLGSSLISNELKLGTIITATADLARMMRKKYPEYQIVDIHQIVAGLVEEWEKEVKDIKNFVVLRNTIERYIENAGETISKEEATYLRRNAHDIWNAVLLLVEADVYPDDIAVEENRPLEHFKNIWRSLEAEDPVINKFRAAFIYDMDGDRIDERLNKKKEKRSEKRSEKRFQKDQRSIELKTQIFLLGFYFITPIQQRVFDSLEQAGKVISFLNCYDDKYKYANEIWTKTYPSEYRASVDDIQPDLQSKNSFGDLLNGKQAKVSLNIVKHYSDFEFAEMVYNARKNKELIYSPNAKDAEEVMREFYPELFPQKHLLSYPVGQYIYYLHMIWSTIENDFDMEFSYVKKCFESGWLSVEADGHTINGKDYLYELSVLEPFFRKCHTLKEWEIKIQELLAAKKITSIFDDRKHGHERWHRLLGNPFYNIGIYNISESRLNEISNLIKKIIRDVRALFPSDKNTDLYEHFSRIKDLLSQRIDKSDILPEEMEIVNEILGYLSNKNTQGITCPINGVRDAIIMLIGDHLDDSESQDEETGNIDRIILPLSMIEAAVLKDSNKVHLVLADEFGLPGAPRKLPWPLTDDTLDKIVSGLDSDRNDSRRYIIAMRSVIDNRPLSYRYLFFSYIGLLDADAKMELSIEWVCQRDGKDIALSPYVDIIRDNNDLTEVAENNYCLDKIKERVEPIVEKEIKLQQNVPDLVVMDYLECKQRYLYSYCLNYLPSYVSEFHLSFVMSRVISALSHVSGCDPDTVAKNVNDVFPFFRNIEKRQAADFGASKWSEPYPFILDDVQYPGQAILPHFIDKPIINEILNRLDLFNDDRDNDQANDRFEVSDKMCKYCPFSDICLEKYKEQIDEYQQ